MLIHMVYDSVNYLVGNNNPAREDICTVRYNILKDAWYNSIIIVLPLLCSFLYCPLGLQEDSSASDRSARWNIPDLICAWHFRKPKPICISTRKANSGEPTFSFQWHAENIWFCNFFHLYDVLEFKFYSDTLTSLIFYISGISTLVYHFQIISLFFIWNYVK